NLYVLNTAKTVARSALETTALSTAAVGAAAAVEYQTAAASVVSSGSGGVSSSGGTAWGHSIASKVAEARMKGYEGDACSDCGNFTLVRNGTCMKCDTCGTTSGCS